ncbi:S49 family peptidase [Undibacterium umbellatum]|uniref:S49 family peptidase n=1 Tax=Undibacterium umbellatum TaxID=2762300 RepID=UPI003BB7DA80
MSGKIMNEQFPSSPIGESDKKEGWERQLLEKLATDSLREQRLRRRWSIFFRFAFLSVIIFSFYYFSDYATGEMENLGHHTALIEIDGTIESEGAGSAQTVIPALNRAFADPGSVAVVVRINSPGGSPVQAGMINDEMGRLRKEYPDKKLYVVVDEICASGGYYIAVAADKIFVNKASVVGSIGVLMDGFGFTGLMDKLGVERRLMTAGENKGFMDPFSPQTEKQKAFSQTMLNEIHQQFIDAVRTGRGQRLKETPEMFSGLFWIGGKAVQMGLADDFGSVDSVVRDIVKVENIVDYTQKEGLPERVLKKFGASIGSSAATTMLKGNTQGIR